ncbi:NUDIX hydrolase [Cryptosporangium sp. NPDC051539]|uniref:NUDIX hydrolase n=1 Tax=Cryptosporangium sp. NPDC051539 TaxID=3363962 RepID=UPI00379505CF
MSSPRDRALLDAWDGRAASPRDAATVVLLRDSDDGVETYLLRRQASMAFAAGMSVFPGGGVQASDYRPVPWLGPDPVAWGARLACGSGLAAALLVAAVREVFEETGVLLAGPDASTVVGPVEGAPDARLAVESQAIGFDALLAEHGLRLRADLLGPWARWITPEHQPRRFDTRFFVAVLPEGQTVGRLTSEAESGGWVGIAAALRAAEAGELTLMTPTRHTLTDLLGRGNAAAIVAAAADRPLTTVHPRVVEDDGARQVVAPELDGGTRR